ncbi:MAG: (2Fe-2S)-binding protein [Anaerolineaceae bacterium]|nr:(2Fe-2S)-binding protein [Anaerolineaceae bacterium]
MTLAFRGPGRVPVVLRVNGERVTVHVEPHRTLLDVLRDELGLTGAKHVCGEGNCGACTVLLDGETAYACLTLAIDCEGSEVRTIEGLARDGALHPVQAAFIEHDGYQCGYCTPGQVLAAVALLEQEPNPTEDEIRLAMSGNLCRCGAYQGIVAAVRSVAAGGQANGHA